MFSKISFTLTFLLFTSLLWTSGCGARDRLNKIKDESDIVEDARNPWIEVDNGPENKIEKKHKWTKLHQAARDNNETQVKEILDEGVFANIRSSRLKESLTPLHISASHGNTSIMKLLIEKKADVNAKTTRGMLPIHYAVMNGHLEAVKLLVKEGSLLTKGASSVYASRPYEFSLERSKSMEAEIQKIEKKLEENPNDQEKQELLSMKEFYEKWKREFEAISKWLYENGGAQNKK